VPHTPRISYWAWCAQRTSCGFPYRKPHTRPWVVPRIGNPGLSAPFAPDVGLPLCSTCHLSALVDTQVSMHPWGRTVEVRVSHPLQRAQRMGHPGFVGKEKSSGGHPSGVSDQIPRATSPPLQAERTPLRPLRPEQAPVIREMSGQCESCGLRDLFRRDALLPQE
jgi:hypothetical protein